jgi:enoyl-CoA hydratase
LSESRVFEGDDVLALRSGRVGTIMLDRPKVNAMRTQTWHELETSVDLLAASQAVSVVLLRSAVPGIFSAGADVKELPMAPRDDVARQQLTRRVLDKVLGAPQPYIAALDGPALGGGCALVCAADIRIGTGRTTFGLPEINVGRCGGSRHLMRHLPQGTVRSLYFTGIPLPAPEAHRLGLLNTLADDLDAETAELAGEIASKSPTALRLAKQSLNIVESLDVRTGYEVEQQFTLRLAGSPDAEEAARAFFEKRAPVWQDDPEDGQ